VASLRDGGESRIIGPTNEHLSPMDRMVARLPRFGDADARLVGI